MPKIARVDEETRNLSFASHIGAPYKSGLLGGTGGAFAPLVAGSAGISCPKPLKNHGKILSFSFLESRNTRNTRRLP
jgi:hypothetical protein